MLRQKNTANLPLQPVPNCPTIQFYAELENISFKGPESASTTCNMLYQQMDDPKLDAAAQTTPESVGGYRNELRDAALFCSNKADESMEDITRRRALLQQHVDFHEIHGGCDPSTWRRWRHALVNAVGTFTVGTSQQS